MIVASAATAIFTAVTIATGYVIDLSWLPRGWGNQIPNLTLTAVAALVTGYLHAKASDHRPRGSLWTAIDFVFSMLLIAAGIVVGLAIQWLTRGSIYLGSDQMGVVIIITMLIILNFLFDWVRPKGEPLLVRARVAGAGLTGELSADPPNVAPGGAATLSWQSVGATAAHLSGFGPVDPRGSEIVCPAGTTTYTLTLMGEGGVITRQATVTVT